MNTEVTSIAMITMNMVKPRWSRARFAKRVHVLHVGVGAGVVGVGRAHVTPCPGASVAPGLVVVPPVRWTLKAIEMRTVRASSAAESGVGSPEVGVFGVEPSKA